MINVLALTLGLSSVIFLYVQNKYENSFDIDQPKAERIYRVNTTIDYPNRKMQSGNSQPMLAIAMANEYPELESVVQVIGPRSPLVAIHPGTENEKNFEETNQLFYADSAFLRHFDFDFIAGNERTALDDLNAIVLSTSMVEKYYPKFVGKEAGGGKEIRLFDNYSVYITGIVQDPPSNSNFPFKMLVSSEIYYKNNRWDYRTNWAM